MNNYLTRSLGDIVTNHDSTRVPLSSRERDQFRGSFPYYGAAGVIDFVQDYLFDGMYILIAEDGSVVTSANMPVVQLVRGKFWVNNHAHIIRAETEADTEYIYYALSTVNVLPYLSGSVQPKLTQASMNSIPIPYPDEPIRTTIAHILGTLDDKIEFNRRMNETLEGIAGALFKSWFIDFDPVRAKAEGRQPFGMNEETAALFPSEFEDSELGEIPKGWSVRKLSDICTTQYGYTTSAKRATEGPRLLRVTDINKRDYIVWDEVPYCIVPEEKMRKYELRKGDVVVARMADPGKAAIIDDDVPAIFASYLVRLRANTLVENYYIYGFLKSDLYQQYSEEVKSGSVQANMNAKIIVGCKLVIPDSRIIELYYSIVKHLRGRIAANVTNSSMLREVRDALLPKLMSGEIRVDPLKFGFGAGSEEKKAEGA